jgi:SAM-dependent methyltransferase
VTSLRARLGQAVGDRIALLAPARRLRFQLTADAIEAFAERRFVRILDAGCGDGLLAEMLARRHPSWQIVGIDAREEMLERGRERASRAGLTNVRFVCGDLTQDLGHGIYDVVAAVECLVEIPDDARALAMMSAALRPGGAFIAQVPERHWTPVLPWSERTWRYEIRHGYDRAEFVQSLRRVGLDVLDVRGSCRGLVRTAQEIRDGVKTAPVWLRALAFPLMVLAVRLERWGVTWGRERALFVLARRAERARASG